MEHLFRVKFIDEVVLGQFRRVVDLESLGDVNAEAVDGVQERRLRRRVHHALLDRAAVARHAVDEDEGLEVVTVVGVLEEEEVEARVVAGQLRAQLVDVNVVGLGDVDLLLVQLDMELEVVVGASLEVFDGLLGGLSDGTGDPAEGLVTRVHADFSLDLCPSQLVDLLLASCQWRRSRHRNFVLLVAGEGHLFGGCRVVLLLQVRATFWFG